MQPANNLTNPGTDPNVEKSASLVADIAKSLGESRERGEKETPRGVRPEPVQAQEPQREPEKDRGGEPAEQLTEAEAVDQDGIPPVETQEEPSTEPVFFSLEDLYSAAEMDEKTFLDAVKVPVKWKDGETKTVALKSVIDGYKWDGLNHRRAEEVAAERRKAAEEVEEAGRLMSFANSLVQAQWQELDAQEQAINNQFQMEPWEQLRAQQDGSYADRMAGYQQARAQIQMARDNLNRQAQSIHQEWQARQAKQHEEGMKLARAELLERVPQWADESVEKREREASAKFAMETYGFTQQELGTMYDARLWHLLRDFHHLRQRVDAGGEMAKKQVKQAPKLMKPGAAKANLSAKQDKMRKLGSKLRRSGSAVDLAEMIMNR